MSTGKKIGNILQKIFGWGVFLCLIAGGITFFGFLVALIIGGGEGSVAQTIAVWIQKTYFPIVIRCTAISILIGLVGMYFRRESALSITSDKKEAEDELTAIKESDSK